MGWLNIKGICFRQQRVDNIEKCSAVVFRGKEGAGGAQYQFAPSEYFRTESPGLVQRIRALLSIYFDLIALS